MFNLVVITRDDDNRVSKAMSGFCYSVCVCLSVCLFVRTIKPKRVNVKSPHLAQGYSITIPRPPMNIRSKVKVTVSQSVGRRELCNLVSFECPAHPLVSTFNTVIYQTIQKLETKAMTTSSQCDTGRTCLPIVTTEKNLACLYTLLRKSQ